MRCYRCNKDESSFFFLENGFRAIFWNKVTIFEFRMLPTLFKFLCSNCVKIEIAIQKLKGKEISLFIAKDYRNPCVRVENVHEWLSIR